MATGVDLHYYTWVVVEYEQEGAAKTDLFAKPGLLTNAEVEAAIKEYEQAKTVVVTSHKTIVDD